MKRLQALFFTIFLSIFISCAQTKPGMVTENPTGQKVGRSSTTFIFGFPMGGGDMSIKKAAQNGGITKIATVDHEMRMIFLLMVYSRTTIVTGN
jgi:hypothetical protein